MSDDLRTRIAAALREALLSEIGGSIDGVDNIYVGDETVHLVILADAVIRELGLTRQDNEMDTSGPYRYRYVTGWEVDE